MLIHVYLYKVLQRVLLSHEEQIREYPTTEYYAF